MMIPRWRDMVILHFLKQALHRLGRHKVHSFIIIIGLTIGMSASLLILFYCRFERSYDDYHRHADRIFRVQNDQIGATQTIGSACCPPGLAPAMKREFPEIVDFTRILNVGGDTNIVSRTLENRRILAGYEPHVCFAETSLLRIFSFPLVSGDARSALDRPEAVVLAESTAHRYFGDENPIGHTVAVITTFGKQDYLVTGVCRDFPVNSHFRFDILLSYQRLKSLWPFNESNPWKCHTFLTYLLLSPTANIPTLEAKSSRLINDRFPLSDSTRTRLSLQPLRGIHLTSRLHQEADVNGDYQVVVLLEWIGLFILLTAWVNTVNLATARSMEQGREVGVRKTLGAGRRHILGQFLTDALLHNLLALLFSLVILHAFLVPFGQLVGKPLWTVQLGVGWLLVTVTILAGAILSVAYPAFLLSSLPPVFALRGLFRGVPRAALMRKGLVLVQFTLATMLIAATLVVGNQLDFMQSRDLGADISRTMVLRVPALNDSGRQSLLARERMAGLAGIVDASVATSIPGREYSNDASGFRRANTQPGAGQTLYIIDIDECYFECFDIPLIAGRTFSKGFVSDRNTVVLNEEAVKVLGFADAAEALGQKIIGFGARSGLQIIGVTRNYHHKSLRDRIEPVVYWPLPYSLLNRPCFLALKYRGSVPETVPVRVKENWQELFPGVPIDSVSLNADFSRQYDGDTRFGQIFGLASLLAVAIACLGLFGLASYATARRKREIGVRKVFGASVSGITIRLAGEFIRWVLLANALAWPLTYLAMRQWLENFAYRTPIGIGVFLMAGVLVLLVAMLTVSVQSVRAARANPVESLRYE
jgi:putative ABC transport system permease protein